MGIKSNVKKQNMSTKKLFSCQWSELPAVQMNSPAERQPGKKIATISVSMAHIPPLPVCQTRGQEYGETIERREQRGFLVSM